MSTPSSRSPAVETALRLLSRRARTRDELDALLERRGFAPDDRRAALQALAGWGYLDDARVAEARATKLLGEGRYGARRVIMRLEAAGVPPREARAAVRSASQQTGFEARAAALALLARRGLNALPLAHRLYGKAQRLLLARGFDEELVTSVLGEPSLDPSGEGE